LQLGLEQPEPFARQLDDGGFLPARLTAAAPAPNPQSCTQVRLGELLGLQIGQKRFERFNPRRGVARGIRQVLLVSLDFEFGDLRDRSVWTDVPHEPIDLARCQLALTRLQPAKVLRCNLPQPLLVGFLYDYTSTWEPCAGPVSG
jgi:hypothetical protein